MERELDPNATSPLIDEPLLRDISCLRILEGAEFDAYAIAQISLGSVAPARGWARK